MKKKSLIFLIISLIFSVLLIILPILVFYLNFKNQEISNNLTHWASFGDYIGGTLNTIISFISLVILGYLTYLLSNQSISENKKMNLLMKRLDSYNELTNYIPKINLLAPTLNRMIASLLDEMSDPEKMDSVEYKKKKETTINNLNIFSEFHFFLFTFNVRYGHLYKIDFNQKEFQLLIDSSNEVHLYFQQVTMMLELNKIIEKKVDTPNMNLLFERLAVVINLMREELN